MIRLPDAKLIEYPRADGGWHSQLFLLEQEPGERDDALARAPGRARELRERLEEWRAATGTDTAEVRPLPPEILEGLRDLGYVE